MPSCKEGDFVIFRDVKKRKQLLQVSGVDGEVISGTLDKGRAYDPKQAQFHVKDLMAVLGPKPEHGSAYGVNIEPYYRTLKHEHWGDIHLFMRLTKAQWVAIKAGLDRAYKDLQKNKLHGLIDAGNLSIEIRPPKGKNFGMYYYVQRGEEAKDRFIIRARDEGPENEPDLYRELAHHEMGHGLTWRGMTKKMRARWIRLHAEFCNFTEHSADDVKSMGQRFFKSLANVRAFRDTLETDEEIVLFDTCLSQIAADYRCTAKDIDWLLEGDDLDTVKAMWPQQELRYTEFEEALGDYAMKNWREFIAEAFRIKHTKTAMPKRIDALMNKVIEMVPTIIGKQ
jgi:hypothetical protein